MSKGKWGESFLKSGLPLEYLTLVTFKSLDWDCWTHIEYTRSNRESGETWFELDLEATYPFDNKDTRLSFIVECKYHDLSRFWFFLPYETTGRWHFNDRVFNCGPLQTLVDPKAKKALELAPISNWGIVVSEDGTKQDNAAYTAIQQIVNAFVPYSLMAPFSYDLDSQAEDEEEELDFVPTTTAIVPMIITNATLFRLKPAIDDLNKIRDASSPHEIADEINWTWHYYDPPMSLINQNRDFIESYINRESALVHRFPFVESRLRDFDQRPNWIAVVNIKYLPKVVRSITKVFQSLRTRTIKDILRRGYKTRAG